jgi:hypothetical protein
MTDKKFVKLVNPTLEHNGYKFDVTKNGIFIRGGEDSPLLCLPIPLKYEKQMYATLRKIAEYKMLKKLES